MKIKSLTEVLLSAFTIRLLVTGASIGDALAMLSLSALYGYWIFTDQQKEPVANKEIKDRLVELEEKIQTTSNKVGAIALNRR